MAYGDPIYQINDLTARIKVLENMAKASNPGNLPSRGPNHPLAVVTSSGQSSAGSDSDNFSRAFSSAVEQALAAAYSVVDVNVQTGSVNFGGGVTQSLHQTNYLRPDSIVGDTYRISACGVIANGTGVGQTVQFQFRASSGGTLITLGTLSAALTTQTWWLHLYWCVRTAGAAGTFFLNSRLSRGDNSLPSVVTQDFLAIQGGVFSSVASIPELLIVGSIADPTLAVSLEQYSQERLGTSSFVTP